MGINLIDQIVPKNGGAFPMVEDVYFLGGYQVRADNAGRDAVPTLSRKQGMLVFTIDSGKTWRLGPGLTNADWVEVTSGGGGGGQTLTFDPTGITDASQNVYATWAEIQTAGATIQAAGANFQIVWVAPAGFVFPAGGPYLTGTAWINNDLTTRPTLQVADTVTFSEWPLNVGQFQFDFQGSTAILTTTLFACYFTGTLLSASGSAIPFNLSGSNYIQLIDDGFLCNITNGGVEVFNVAAASQLIIDLRGPSTDVAATTIRGQADSTLAARYLDEQSSLDPVAFANQTGFLPGNVSLLQLDKRHQFPGWSSGLLITTSAAVTSLDNNHAIPVDTSGGPVTITLPDSATLALGPEPYTFTLTVTHATTDANAILLGQGNVADKIQGVAANLDLTTLFTATALYSVTIGAVWDGSTFTGYFITGASLGVPATGSPQVPFTIDSTATILGSYPSVSAALLGWFTAFGPTWAMLQIRDGDNVSWDGTLQGTVGVTIASGSGSGNPDGDGAYTGLDLSGFVTDPAATFTPIFFNGLRISKADDGVVPVDDGWNLYFQNCSGDQVSFVIPAVSTNGGAVWLAENTTWTALDGTPIWTSVGPFGFGVATQFSSDSTCAIFQSNASMFVDDGTGKNGAEIFGSNLYWYPNDPAQRLMTDGSIALIETTTLYTTAGAGQQLFDAAFANIDVFRVVCPNGGITFGTTWTDSGSYEGLAGSVVEILAGAASLPAFPDAVPAYATAGFPSNAFVQNANFDTVTSGKAMGPALAWNPSNQQWEGANGAVAMYAFLSSVSPPFITVANATPYLDGTTDLYRTNTAPLAVTVGRFDAKIIIVGNAGGPSDVTRINISCTYRAAATPVIVDQDSVEVSSTTPGTFTATAVAAAGGLQVQCDQGAYVGSSSWSILATSSEAP